MELLLRGQISYCREKGSEESLELRNIYKLYLNVGKPVAVQSVFLDLVITPFLQTVLLSLLQRTYPVAISKPIERVD